MPKRIRSKPTLLTPAGNFIKRLRESDDRLRRRVTWIVIGLIGLFLVWSSFDSEYGLTRIARLRMQERSMVRTNQRQMAELIDAVRIRELLRTDRGYIEYIARTRYHMAAPNETIYRFRGR